jgi:ATP-dependent Clp protease ATP-binding subunit ClpC
VGSHHLLLAALTDDNSAASAALASLGVDVGELKEKLRTMPVTGTSDELPQEAGRRQMAIQVSDEMLTLVLTDPIIVAAGQNALRAVKANAAALAVVADEEAEQPAAQATASSVIRGDYPAAAGLADVWEELRKTLTTLADTAPPATAA